jgi:squalene-hopene/tetraprenyl-beta-curcumene cyclase
MFSEQDLLARQESLETLMKNILPQAQDAWGRIKVDPQAPHKPQALVKPAAVAYSIPGVEGYTWYRGCSITSLTMILNYWGKHNFPDLYDEPSQFTWQGPEICLPWPLNSICWCENKHPYIARELADEIADELGVPQSCRKVSEYGTSVTAQKKAVITVTRNHGYDFQAYIVNWSNSYNKLKFEIDAGRPVKLGYDAVSGPKVGGHAIVVCGYNYNNTHQIEIYTTGSTSPTWRHVETWQQNQQPVWNLLIIKPKVSPIQKGLNWLRANQNSDGGWGDGGSDPGITGLVVLALLNAGYDEDSDSVVRDGLSYLENHVEADGSINGYNYYTSIAIWAFVAADRNNVPKKYGSMIQNAKDYLLSGQCVESHMDPSDPYYGGWGYMQSDRDSWADLSNTQFVLMALDAAYNYLGLTKPSLSDSSGWIGRAIQFIERCQNRPASNDQAWSQDPSYPSYNDGGFIYHPGWSQGGGEYRSYGSMTYAGIWSYLLAGLPVTDARVSPALQWVEDNYSITENVGAIEKGTNWALFYYFYTMTKTLSILGESQINSHFWYEELADHLGTLQDSAGYWVNGNPAEMEGDKALCTAYSILALETQYLVPSGKQLSWSITLACPADLHLYDKFGRHTGINYATGELDEEIPGAVFSFEPPDDPAGHQHILIREPDPGSYRIVLVGTGDGAYTLTSETIENDTVVEHREVAGPIQEGEELAASVSVASLIGALNIEVNTLLEIPTGLEAMPGDQTVTLHWKPYTAFEVTGYNIYRSTTSGASYVKINTELVTTPAHHDNGLTNGVTYYYVVTAVDTSDNETSHSREASAMPTAGFFNFEYTSQAAMETVGWACQGLWHLTNETECAGLLPNPTPFPSSTRAAHFCSTSGTYAGPASLSLSSLSPKQRAQRAQTSPMAEQAKSYGELITPDIHVTSQTQVDLRFHYFREVEHYVEGSYDKTYVQVQFDGGAWQTVWSLDSKTPSEKAWTEVGPITISVSAGASTMRIKFVFDSVDSYGNDYLGWLIDDISISGPEPVTLRITTQGLPSGTVNQAYSTTLSAAGGTPAYTWSAIGLPSGLSLNSSTGLISGTPTSSGTSAITVTVTDSASKTASREYQLTVNPEPVGVLYEEDFTDPTGWTVGGLWHTTSALGCVDLTGQGSVAYYGIDAACNYNTVDRTTGELTSPPIDVSSAVAVQIRFDHFRQVEYFEDGAYDQTYLQARLGDGTWKTIWASDSTYPSEEAWTQVTVGPFSTGGAQTLQLRFGFDSVDRWANSFIGWLVDSVRIEPAASGSPLSAMAVQVAIPRDAADLISVFNVPNPVRDVHTTQFVVRGVEAETIRVEVYDLSGRLVWEGEGLGNELPWHTEGLDGLPLANGVYIYRVYVEVDGDWIASGIQKLVILR